MFTNLHRDERGSISLATVFALLLLTMLLGMVINAGRQVDNKVKLQNAADTATYSGGVVLARGMNSLAYTNHMLTEVFALTAFMREARDRHSDQFVPTILAAWDSIGPVLGRSGFQKFDQLGPAIPQKTQAEQQMVSACGSWMSASSEVVLPVLEEILAQEMIPQLQRQIVATIPSLAQTATASIANRNTGRPSPRDQARGPIIGVLWRTRVEPVGGASEAMQGQGTIPAVDPATDQNLVQQAAAARNTNASRYLGLWNNELMQPFDQYAKMSQFGALWRGFTCGQLQQLFQQYPTTNLPHLIRPPMASDPNTWLEQDYMFVGVAYRPKVRPTMSRLFADSLQSDNQAFAQGSLFVPRRRPIDVLWGLNGPYFAYDRGMSLSWDLWNENWSFQLVPATATSMPLILQTPPQTPAAAGVSLRLPNLQNVSSADVQRLTTH